MTRTGNPMARLRHVVYVDAGFSNGKGRLSWYNENTGNGNYKKADCKDSFRCEYAALVFMLGNCKDFARGDEVEVRMDNEVVVKQLNHNSAINDEDVRKEAFKIWKWGKSREVDLTYVRVPRKDNKAGKILGS
jgi:ribonuclease HI